MSTAENKRFVRRLWDELVNGARFEALDDLVSPEFLDHTPLPGLPSDAEGLKQRLVLLHEAFPDFHSTILELVAEEDQVVAVMTSTGTHERSFLGVPPTGRSWTIMEFHLLRISGGRLVEHWGLPDFFGMLEQLGLVSPPWQSVS
ncbi:MAG TPA: ester cyclase [Pirellulales bacterium]|nr:ester cyclase [Pirellulales bacterium]